MDVYSFWHSLKIPIPKTTNHQYKSGFKQPTFLIAISVRNLIMLIAF
jgi:hypothetical protein